MQTDIPATMRCHLVVECAENGDRRIRDVILSDREAGRIAEGLAVMGPRTSIFTVFKPGKSFRAAARADQVFLEWPETPKAPMPEPFDLPSPDPESDSSC